MLTVPDPTMCPAFTALDTAGRAGVKARAGFVIWALSGRKFGTEQVTVRPVTPLPPPPTNPPLERGGYGWSPLNGYGQLAGLGCGPQGVVLDGPVQTVDEVVVDGQILSPATYRLLDAQLLVPVAPQAFPLTQSLALPLTAPGTMSVKYTRGTPFTADAESAASALACEFAKAAAGDASCRLPDRVQTLVREGVSITMIDPADYLTGGFVGVAAIDLWLQAVNPTHQAGPASSWSPDLPRLHRT